MLPPLAVTGKDPAGLGDWFDTWEGPLGGGVRNVKLTIGGDVAFWNGLVNMAGTKKDGEKVDLWFRQTLGLVEEGRPLAGAHEHASVPLPWMAAAARCSI